MQIVYLIIVALVLVLVVVNMFKKKDNLFFQIDAALVTANVSDLAALDAAVAALA